GWGEAVMAPPCYQLTVNAARRIVQLEHKSAVVIDTAAECSGESDAVHVDAPVRQQPDTAFEQLQRRPERDIRLCGESVQRSSRRGRCARHSEEARDQRAGFRRQSI